MNDPPEGAPRFAAGDLLAHRFRVVRFLDRGGTGEVYEALEEPAGGRLALKAVHRALAGDPEVLERLRREVAFAADIGHPNVCRTYELVEDGADRFITMELLDGESLEARLERGPMRPQEALPIVRQMASALSAAHDTGLVHGDFKSSNVMLVPDGGATRAVVTDFGTAPRPRDVDWRQPSDTVVGTPAYMAPEQAQGLEIGPAADIYAFGVVLYEMVTGGELPHHGDTAAELLRERVDVLAPTPRGQVPILDLRWELVILQCLEPEPEDRFRTLDDAVRALEGGSIALSSSGEFRRTRRRRGLVAGALLAVAAALVTWWLAAR